MKKGILFAFCCLVLQGFAYANEVPLFQDSEENQEYRVEVANSSIRAAHLTLARIQQLAHNDPDKACDLVCNAVKYLINAESCLYTGSDVK